MKRPAIRMTDGGSPSIEKPCGFFDAKEERLRASEILTDFRATR